MLSACWTVVGQLPQIDAQRNYSFGMRLANSAVSYVAYLRKMVWPDDLAVLYPFPLSFSPAKVVPACALLILITFFVFHQRHRRPYMAVGWAWYLIGLVPGGVRLEPELMGHTFVANRDFLL